MAKKPWHKRDDEDSKQYAAFQCYYLLDPVVRSIPAAIRAYNTKAGRDLDAANSRFKYWSSQHDWVARAEAWDEHVWKKRENAYLRGTEKGAEKNAINIEEMRSELAEKFDEIGGGADDLLKQILENPDKYNIKLSEINGLQRVRLDIFRALAKTEEKQAADKDPLAELETQMKDW